MPRSLSPALAAALEEGVVSLSLLVRIDRRDGVSLGFTDADSPLTVGGLTHLPTESVGVSALQAAEGTGVDNMDVMGVLTDDRITEADLSRGLYDGARITVSLVDRAALASGRAVLLVGTLGETSQSRGAFQAEVRSLSSRLKQTVGDTTSKVCRCRRVGDAQCRANMGATSGGFPRRATRTVANASGNQVTLAADSAPTGFYAWGIVTMLSGANAGTSRDVKMHASVGGQAVLTLRGKFPSPVESGASCSVDAGCDRQFPTCRDKFQNANNYRGEWHLPTNDVVLKVGRT